MGWADVRPMGSPRGSVFEGRVPELLRDRDARAVQLAAHPRLGEPGLAQVARTDRVLLERPDAHGRAAVLTQVVGGGGEQAREIGRASCREGASSPWE